MKKILTVFLVLSFLTSCSTVKTGTSKTIDIVGSGVMHKPVIADLIVQQNKVSKTVTFTKLESLETARNNVVRELLNENNADVLVEPTFESSTTNNQTELTVYGWTASYQNFRQIVEDDIKYLEVQPSYLQKAESHQPVVQTRKGITTGSVIMLSVAVVALGVIFGIS